MVDEPDQLIRSKLDQLIQALGPRFMQFGPKPLEEIQTLAAMFNLKLPQEYASFLQRYGSLAGEDVQILGLADADRTDLAVENTILMLRLGYAQMPLNLLPIEELGDGLYAGLVCSEQEAEQAPVMLLDLARPEGVPKVTPLAPRFLDYLYNRLIIKLGLPLNAALDQVDIEHGLAVLETHVRRYNEKFHYEHKSGGKLPANHDWRPYRYCIQDVLFGAVVVQHDREYNRLNVDVFLTTDIPEYEPLAGAQALATFLLSEAYKCGGSMEIHFTPEVQGGQVPRQLQELVAKFGLSFAEADQGRISAQEAKALYAVLTGFSDEFKERLGSMEADGLVKMVQACYVVHHGVWTRRQVEMLVLGSEHPDRILSGAACPGQRHLYMHDLLHARAAVLGGLLDRALSLRDRTGIDRTTLDLEDDFRPVNSRVDGTRYVWKVRCEEDLPIPWLVSEKNEHLLPAGVKFDILIRARDSVDLKRHFAEDLKQATTRHSQTDAPTFVLVPYDFTELDEAERQDWIAKCRAAHIGLLVCPETTINLDAEAAQKLSQSRILRK